MLRQISLMSAVFSVLLLTGCTPGPTQLGVSAQQWQSMSDQQRQQILQGYQQIQNQPRNDTVYAGPKIVVSLAEGTAMMPPFVQPHPYHPVQFALKPGECLHVPLESANSNQSVNLPACYNGLVLALDPSRYDPILGGGSLRFNYTPVWKRGFAYNGVSSQGYVRLSKVNVIIHAMAKAGSLLPPTDNTKRASELQTEPLQPILKPGASIPSASTPAIPTPMQQTQPTAEQPQPVESSEPTSEEKLAPVEDIVHLISH